MCLFGGGGSPPPPPPLPPAPPPPEPPRAPTPPPEPVQKDIDPRVRRARTKSKKKGSNYSEGTGALRIKLNPKVNTGTDAQSGGLN